MDVKQYKCRDCQASYSFNKSLRRHVKQHHAGKVEELAPKLRDTKTYDFVCDKCGARFNELRNFSKHKRDIHDEGRRGRDIIIKELKCPLCVEEFSKSDLITHFQDEHNIEMELENLQFSSFDEFKVWKDNLEKNIICTYVTDGGTKRRKDLRVVHHFHCHRSGHFVSKGKGKRHLKIQGTKKINAYCPSSIKVVVESDERCAVEYFKTHVGHDNPLTHIVLTKEERGQIAAKIASGVSFEAILDYVRTSISPSELKRLDLLTRQDLHNIEASYNLASKNVYHKNDKLSVQVDAWVYHMQQSSNDCVLYFKPQNSKCGTHENLNNDDFVLILMNEAQIEMLKKYGSDCICMDSTHGTNGYNFELVTLLVLDDMREGFPCAFLFASRVDQEIMELFLAYVKDKTGDISPKVFMSDMAETFFNAWRNIMSTPEFRLFCAWHIDRAWRKNLKRIKSSEKQVETYKMLRTLMEESDEKSFKRLLGGVLQKFSEDDELEDFGVYFTDYYSKSARQWAYCYRINSGINTNMHIERMHRTMKYIYLHGKNNKRLDKAIHALMKFLRDKLFDRLITASKGKVTTKLKALRARHKTSKTLKIEVVQNSGKDKFLVQSSTAHDIFIVEKRNVQCSCKLICDECKMCIHAFSCTCVDYGIKWNMCKHIHLVCTHIQEHCTTTTEAKTDSINDLEIDMSNADRDDEIQSILSVLGKNDSPESLEREIEEARRDVFEQMTRISCREHLNAFKQSFASIKARLNWDDVTL